MSHFTNYRKLIAIRLKSLNKTLKESMTHLSRKEIRELTYTFIKGEFPHVLKYNDTNPSRPIMPNKPTIQDYLMTRWVRTEDNQKFVESYGGNGESWSKAALFTNNGQDDEEIIYDTGYGYYYSGPGRGFAGEPYIERSKHSIIVRWSGGLDI